MLARKKITIFSGAQTGWMFLIVCAATSFGMLCSWRAPGLNLYSQDLLMRERGGLPEPDNIAIVAIDESSIERLGRFPWRRDSTASVLDIISQAAPKAIALDVHYPEPTAAADDEPLRQSISNAGNVVIGEQLVEGSDSPELCRLVWLRDLPIYLDITKLEAGTQMLRLVPVSLSLILDQILLLIEPLALQRGIKIARDFDDGGQVLADEQMINLAFTNIVGNAVKYSPDNTAITIQIRTVANGIEVKITDQGFGIDEDQLPRIFEKFYRFVNVQNSEIPGTGLGLALTREIVELHSGNVRVKSKANEGTEFTVFLPTAKCG